MQVKNLGRVWTRLSKMSPAELIDRGRQEVSKRVDTLFPGAGSGSRISSGHDTFPGQFFFSADSVAPLTLLLRQSLPRQADKIISEADKILVHKFDLLGFENLDVGNPIDWHRDPLHDERSPSKAFYKVRYLDFEECGDSKIVWELNRHQHLVTLAKAYRLTGDGRYSDELFRQWEHWHSENPYPFGINWASSLEVAFRSLSWLWTYHLLEGTAVMPPGFHRQWLQSQARNGRHIERYLSTYFSANTHLLGEAVALFFLGVLCPQLPQAARWKSRGWQTILQQSSAQVLPDGFHFEQSVYYHVYAVDLFLHSLILARRNGIAVPAEFERTIERMLDALALLGRSGTVPGLGDDDGGRLFDPRRNHREHMLDPLATGAILFRRSDFRALAENLREETLWLLGEQGIAEWSKMEPAPPPICSAALASAGYYVLTTSDPPSELVIDAGPQGAQSAGHGHADALSACLQSRGSALLIDPGTYQYVGDAPERDRFRSTAMHNAVCVDGVSQSDPAGPFAWRQLVRGKAERWIQGESFDLFIGSHDGYRRLDPSIINPSIIHRRWVLALRPGLFLVRDVVHGSGRHRVDISWHLGPGLQDCGNGLFSGQGRDAGLALLTLHEPGWTEAVVTGDWSPVYGEKLPATVVQCGTVGDLPVETVTLLLPLPRRAAIPTTWSRMAVGDLQVQAYRSITEAEEYQFFFAEGGTPWRHGQVASDARLVCWQRTHDAAGTTLIMCDGSYVEVEGKRILDCMRRVERCEFLTQNGETGLSCSDAAAIEVKSE